MTLEVCKKDFEALIKRFEVQKAYEKQERYVYTLHDYNVCCTIGHVISVGLKFCELI